MITPTTEAALAEAVAGATGALLVQGGGTRGGGAPAGGGTPLSVAGITGITLYEPGALTLVARAGTPVAEVEDALAAEGQRLPFEPMDHRGLLGTTGEPTIGGMVAANVSGPRRIQAGACRDSVIGVRFVTGSGEIVKNGGRVMKNVTGYDLVKLMAGSHGTLGVLTEVSLKVLPAPSATATLRLSGLGTDAAIRAMCAALGSPFEVTGAAHLPAEPATLIRIEGFESSVDYRAGRLAELLAGFGPVASDPDADWAAIRDAALFHGTGEDVWRISVKPTDGARVAEALPAARLMFDWGGGLVWAGTEPGTDIRPALAGIPGHATLLRAGPETRARLPRFQPEPAPVAQLSAGLRARFDPRGILNPGYMGHAFKGAA